MGEGCIAKTIGWTSGADKRLGDHSAAAVGPDDESDHVTALKAALALELDNDET